MYKMYVYVDIQYCLYVHDHLDVEERALEPECGRASSRNLEEVVGWDGALELEHLLPDDAVLMVLNKNYTMALRWRT